MPLRRAIRVLLLATGAAGTLVLAVGGAEASSLRRLASARLWTLSVGSYERGPPVGEVVAQAMQVAPRRGGWFLYYSDGTRRLARISETGGGTVELLPSKFRGSSVTTVEFVPLHDGWGLLTGRYWRGGLSEQDKCSGGPVPGVRCGELIVSQRSPAGSWTAIQAMPHSFGTDAQNAGPIEVHGKVELAWWEYSGGPFRIAAARLGMPFSRAKKVEELPETRRVGPEAVGLLAFHGQLYVRGMYVVEGKKATHFEVLRLVSVDGRLGPPVVFREGVIEEPFEPGEGFEGANGSELLPAEPYRPGENLRVLAIRRRAAGSGGYEAPRLVMKHLASEIGSPGSYTQSQNHRTLVTLKQETAHGVVLSSVEISPHGDVGPVRPVERVTRLPGEEGPGYTWQGAVSNAGSALVATTSNVPTTPIWLHPAGAKCPSFGRKIALGYGDLLGIIAGHKGSFHIVWTNAKSELEVTSARVTCSASASTRYGQ